MGRKSLNNSVPKSGNSFDSRHHDPRIKSFQTQSPAVTAARKRIEDLKLAREVGVPLSEIL